jgi:NO-binding membrane sensor protein with MHYT domain
MYEYTGYVKNDSGTITVASQLGYNAVSTSLTITLAADNTNNALGISVVGRNATNIRWVATVFTSEVSWS